MDKDGKILSPKAKWKNNFSNLSKAEKDMLDFFNETIIFHKIQVNVTINVYLVMVMVCLIF